MVSKHLLTVLVRLFLEKHDTRILKFVAEFAKMTVSDEKVSSAVRLFLLLDKVIAYRMVIVILSWLASNAETKK